MIDEGTNLSVGTIYRSIHQLGAHGLVLREWDNHHKVWYRSKLSEQDGPSLRLICNSSGRSFTIADPELHARLLAAAGSKGLTLTGPEMVIHVDCVIDSQLAATHKP